MLLQILSVLVLMISAALCAPGSVSENMVRLESNTNQSREHNFNNLDPIGGNSIVRSLDPYRSQTTKRGESKNIMREARRNRKPHYSSGTLDSIGGGHLLGAEEFTKGGARQNMMRLARSDNKPLQSGNLDPIGGGNFVKPYEPYRNNQFFRSLDRAHLLDSLDSYQGGDVLRMLEAVTGGDLLSSLDSAERMAVVDALKKTHTKYPKRMLDSLNGMAFGESKRNFDEIDNVGFTGFAKKSPRGQYSSLAKKNFDEIDRAGFETYNKRNFDEIDRAGFDTYQKRNRKD